MKTLHHQLCEKFRGDRHAFLMQQLILDTSWTTERAHRAIAQYLMFLSLAASCKVDAVEQAAVEQAAVEQTAVEQILVPTADIDRVWETDILQNTEHYMRLCEWLCGSMIHHVGGEGMELAFARTCRLFVQQFGLEALGHNPTPAACGVLILPAKEFTASDSPLSSAASPVPARACINFQNSF